ncbi:hypothetical protein [Streptomyces bobili]
MTNRTPARPRPTPTLADASWPTPTLADARLRPRLRASDAHEDDLLRAP